MSLYSLRSRTPLGKLYYRGTHPQSALWEVRTVAAVAVAAAWGSTECMMGT
jgi:hypothetical protein